MTTLLDAAIARVEAAGAARPCAMCANAPRTRHSCYCRPCATEHQHQRRLQMRRERMEAALSALIPCQAQVNGDDCEEDAREGYRTCEVHAPVFMHDPPPGWIDGPAPVLRLVENRLQANAKPLPAHMTLEDLKPLRIEDFIYTGQGNGP